MKLRTALAVLLAAVAALVLVRSTAVLGDAKTPTELSQAAHLQGVDLEKVDWKAKDGAYWARVLTTKQVEVCREGGTEWAGSGGLLNNHEPGVFVCSSCGQPLFSADAKFDSGTGWPSYFEPIEPGAVTQPVDTSHGMVRTEVRCSRCGAHLGHVFDDGPEPTGKRYCINSVCLLHAPPR